MPLVLGALVFLMLIGLALATQVGNAPLLERRRRGSGLAERPSAIRGGAPGYAPLDLGGIELPWPSERAIATAVFSNLPWPSETWDDNPFATAGRDIDRRLDPSRAQPVAPPQPQPDVYEEEPIPVSSFERELDLDDDDEPTGPTPSEVQALVQELGLSMAVKTLSSRYGWDFQTAAAHVATALRGRTEHRTSH